MQNSSRNLTDPTVSTDLLHTETHPFSLIEIILGKEEFMVLSFHTETHPFCLNPTCGCHEHPTLIARLLDFVRDGLLTLREAAATAMGEML